MQHHSHFLETSPLAATPPITIFRLAFSILVVPCNEREHKAAMYRFAIVYLQYSCTKKETVFTYQ